MALVRRRAAVGEIRILGDDHVAVIDGVAPDDVIGGLLETHVLHMGRPWEEICEGHREPEREVLVEEELQRTALPTIFPSRSAANARAARMSSRSSFGKSARISSSLIPEARYSRMS